MEILVFICICMGKDKKFIFVGTMQSLPYESTK